MSPGPMGITNQPVFYFGWRRNLQRLRFAARCIAYLLQPGRYPLFRVSASRNGLVRTFRIERKLGLTKTIGFNGSYFMSMTIPRYPSPAFDHAVAKGVLNIGGAGTQAKQHVENVILGITRRCDYNCEHCYERRNIAPQESVPIARWKEVLAEIQEIGVSNVILSGGEPMLRYDGLLELLQSGRKELSDFHVHTSGYGITADRARELRQAGLTAAAIGLDDVDGPRFERLRGFPGAFHIASEALGYFNQTGIYTYLNLCVTPELVRSGDLWRYFELARGLKVGMIQILEPRPCGGYEGRPMDELMTESDRRTLNEFVRKGNTERRFKNYPLLYYIAHIESPELMGCTMGGLSHFTIDSAGDVRPCVFVPVSFGNIMKEDLRPIFVRMRQAIPAPIHKPCPAILLSEIAHSRRVHNGGPVRYEDIAPAWKEAVG